MKVRIWPAEVVRAATTVTDISSASVAVAVGSGTGATAGLTSAATPRIRLPCSQVSTWV